ncbi:MAG: 30S ribosomal protein S8, partial [Candidatus Woesebacteria bacterium]|nr:30S ribosomal protein S8 [Candidatus Woesebacteria bacterium]
RPGNMTNTFKNMNKTFSNYSVGDFLIRIKNTAMAKNKSLEYKAEKQIVAVAEALKKLGFLDSVKREKDMLNVSLAFKNKKPVIMNLRLISKPGLRIYMGADEIDKKKGPSTYLITSPKGIISSKDAVKGRIGGEVIAEIWS